MRPTRNICLTVVDGEAHTLLFFFKADFLKLLLKYVLHLDGKVTTASMWEWDPNSVTVGFTLLRDTS